MGLPLLLAFLLLAPAAADAKLKKVAVSTTAAGVELPAYAASSAPITLDLISARFAELDGKMNALGARFRQSVHLEGAETVQRVEGEILFKRPNMMRLTHSLPEKQVVVSDGAWLWTYRPSAKQVIKTRLEDWRKKEPLAAGLLDFGRSAELLKRYDAVVSTISSPGTDGHRTFAVALTPKSADRAAGGDDFTLTLTASTKDFFPGSAELQAGPTRIRSAFEKVRLNPETADDAFRFSPPADADVFVSPSP